MGWETRRNGRRYYYRKRRIGGRVVSEYLGCGAEAIAAELELAESLGKRMALRKLVDDGRPLDEQLEDHAKLIFAEVENRLIEHGYHKHRGQWRKKRGGTV